MNTSYGNDWSRIKIPGAKCGDGTEYSVFYQEKNHEKLLVEFMGGGVCWDYASCFQRISIFPWMHQYPKIDSYSVFTSSQSKLNPFKGHSKLYFPYCTADVYTGNHISHYKNRTVYHYGRKNIYLALKFLASKGIIGFEQVNNLVVYGASAGGIASLLFSKKLESLVLSSSKKTMIVDSPGLHFGKSFWHKFDDKMRLDFKDIFHEVGVEVDFEDGAISKKMYPFLSSLNQWEIGFVLGLKDYVMSNVFGNISPEEQMSLILSKDGLPEMTSDLPFIKYWLKKTYMHTFLLSKYSANLKSLDDVSVHGFVDNVYRH
jgi:hypothetical protein